MIKALYKIVEAIKGLPYPISNPIIDTGWVFLDVSAIYLNSSSFKILTDFTDIFKKGTKIKIINNGVLKYFYVVSSSYSSPYTTIVITGVSSLVSSSLSDLYYSFADCPKGFKPKSYYCAKFRCTTAPSIPTGAETTISLDTVDFNGGGASLNIGYVCPFTGFYEVHGVTYYASSTVASQMTLIRINGVSATYGPRITGYSSAVSTILYCVKGDVIQLGSYHTTGSSQALNSNSRTNHLSVAFLGV